jgi:hypothetical protein
MSQEALKQKITQAINDIITDSGIDLNGLPAETQKQIQDGVAREADKKSIRIFEYLNEFVFNRVSAIEGRIENLEGRLETLDQNDPRNTVTNNS